MMFYNVNLFIIRYLPVCLYRGVVVLSYRFELKLTIVYFFDKNRA
ncbi:hypothetical protein KL86DYS2_10288 [uncultured Dysgonomonas sp.]|uniref:Uncharacterized protein n=1 Tax=uncultured Dysgonomonas sp. TaxID=206096 RepID=A0A212IXT9_9BACT|nr:hypothetical protein KL86DYS2_10288 [uncultured Dysgonomonas sp.]